MAFFTNMLNWTGTGEKELARNGVQLFIIRAHRTLDQTEICLAFATRGYFPIYHQRLTSHRADCKCRLYFAILPGQDPPPDFDWQSIRIVNRKCNLTLDFETMQLAPIDPDLPITRPPWPSVFPIELIPKGLDWPVLNERIPKLNSWERWKNLSTG